MALTFNKALVQTLYTLRTAVLHYGNPNLFFFTPHATFVMPAELNNLLQCNSIDATLGNSAEVLVGFGIPVLLTPFCHHSTSLMKS